VCRAANIVHPGEPPSDDPNNTFNRCTCHALTGTPGGPGPTSSSFCFEKSWRKPQRSATRVCGAPLTDEDGNVIQTIPLDDFITLTCKPFDVSQLIQRALKTGKE